MNLTASHNAALLAPCFATQLDVHACGSAFSTAASAAGANPFQRKRMADLARDIFGNPFRPVALDQRWLTSSVLDLARAIYDERAFERMPILADALMDAGCGSEEIIQHCRGDRPHVRGCWAVDLILGKS
jgi:hypothetical protein